jgi:RimJ/RimL family protein N-acetyltransferase
MAFDFGNLKFALGEVLLCPLSIQHTEQLVEAATEDISMYRFNNCPSGIVETESYIKKAMKSKEKGTRYPFLIIFRGRVAGTTSYADYQPWTWQEGNPLQRQNLPDALEIGYTWLSKSATRTPCNTTAKYLLLRHAFEQLNVVRVSFQTDERNSVSRTSLERLGAKFEGVRRAHKVGADGAIRSSALYSMLAEEWQEAREHLESKLPASCLVD